MFPNYINGAKVLFYTPKDYFGVVDYKDKEKIIDINYLAICRYGNDEKYYLFFCDRNFVEISDYCFDSIEECKAVAKKSKENIIWIQNLKSKAEYTFEEIKNLLLKSITEYKCEAELSIYFENNPNQYMIIIYEDHCSFQRCGCSEIRSGEQIYNTLDELYRAKQIDNIVLARDWDKIITFDLYGF